MKLAPTSARERISDALMTRRLVHAIALELWTLYGKDGKLNWVGVERHLSNIVDRARTDVRDSLWVLVSVAAAARPPANRRRRSARANRIHREHSDRRIARDP
jgi:hypothetical protein